RDTGAHAIKHNWIVQGACCKTAAGISADGGDVALKRGKVSGAKFTCDLVISLGPVLRLADLRIVFERQLLGVIESQMSGAGSGGGWLRYGDGGRLHWILRNTLSKQQGQRKDGY